MKLQYFLFSIFISLSFNSYSQDNQPAIQSGGGGGATVGFGYMDLSDLEVFVPNNVSLGSNFLMVGGGGQSFRGRFVMGGSGQSIIGPDVVTDSLDISVSGGMGTFNFGYVVVDKDQFKLYPQLGIGGGGFGINIAKNINVNANSIANDPGHEIDIGKGNFILDGSVNIVTLPVINYDEEEKSYGGMMLGLQLGYLYSFPSSGWGFSGGDVTNGPEFGFNMPYVKLSFGGMGFSKN